jgi:hypothetical protein
LPDLKVERRAIFGSILAVSPAVGTQHIGYGRTRDLSEREARDLVLAGLEPSARQLPKLAMDPFVDANSPTPDFYEFAVTWDNVNGSVIVGFFAVNRATAVVWKLAVCSRVDSAELKRLQDAMRKRIGLARSELRQLSHEAPCGR